MKKLPTAIITAQRLVDSIINDYEEIPYGCGYNIGAEARRRAKAEAIQKELEEKSQSAKYQDETDYMTERKAS